MFEYQRRLYTAILLAIDTLAGIPALWIAYSLRSDYEWIPFFELKSLLMRELLPLTDYFGYWVLFSPFLVLLLWVTQRYPEMLHRPLSRQYARVFHFAAALVFWSGGFLFFFQLDVSRPIWLAFIFFTGLLMVGNRLLAHWVFRSRVLNEHNQIKILIVGTDKRARQVARILSGLRKWGYDVVGHLAQRGQPVELPRLNVLGRLGDLPDLLRDEVVIDEIIFVGSQKKDPETFEQMIQLCEALGIRTRVAADFFPTSIAQVSLEYLDKLPLITFSTVPDHTMAMAGKRMLDFMVASAMLFLWSPLMLLVAVLIKFTSPGPVLYKQVRYGRFGRRFLLYKFRTMYDGAEDRLWELRHLNEMDGPVFKMRNDPRVTPLGRFLRMSSIDELPQLWNVIKGEMSMVGPRAPLAEEVRHYTLRQRRRLSVKPGLTGLWQVSGRNDIDFDRWMELDLEYIDNWTFWLDLRIMLRTIPAVFTARGAR
ncbi:MAG TPA: sugar transferase [Acidobacteriota bacterium]|nr:sugar transferase [Acidobacteriota bacterium]